MAAEPSVTVTSAPRILVVDDTPALLDVIRACLEEEGYHVRPASNRATPCAWPAKSTRT